MTAHASLGRSCLKRSDGDGVAILTLDRPEARNALSEELISAITAELDALAEDSRIRAVVLTANGPVFSSGHDMKEMTARRADPDGGRAYFADILGRCSAMMLRVQRLPQPVIAAVEGVATAAGCQLVASCDLAVAGAEARFSTPGVHIGLFCSTPMVALSRAVGQKKSMEMLLTGDFVSAQEAKAEGLVNRVVPAEELEAATRSLAGRISEASPLVVGVGKQAFYRQLEMPTGQAYAYTKEVMSFNATFADAQEGMCAFLEKRKPEWKGR